MGTLIWLGAIYGIDVSNYPFGMRYQSDIAAMAEAILAADEYAR